MGDRQMDIGGMGGWLLTLVIENKCEKGIAFYLFLMFLKCVINCA